MFIISTVPGTVEQTVGRQQVGTHGVTVPGTVDCVEQTVVWTATGRYSRCHGAGDCGLCGADCGPPQVGTHGVTVPGTVDCVEQTVGRHRSVLTVSQCRGLWTVWSRLWAATGRYSRCHSAGDCGLSGADCEPPQVGTHGVTVPGTVDCVEQTVGRHRSVLTVSQCRGLWTVWSRL